MKDAPKGPQSPRRWLTFSLRTMFIVVTVLCCWLGWESSVVRQRKSLLQEFSPQASLQITTMKQWVNNAPPGTTRIPPASVSFLRRLLGDEAIQEIGYSTHYQPLTEADRARLSRAFPEARIHEIQYDHHLMEPCHPGCFPRGTLVDSPDGRRLIETIEMGDVLTTMSLSGEAQSATVTSVFVTTNVLWNIRTEAGSLLTTKIQPLCLAGGKIKAAGELQPGDMVLHRDGTNVRPVRVLEVASAERVAQVFNVVLGDSEIFVAGGYLARSKPPLEVAAK